MVKITEPESRYREKRRAHWDRIAATNAKATSWGGCYHDRLLVVYRALIPRGKRVLEIGCSTGDLLAGVRPSVGVGVDFSLPMLQEGARRHPELLLIHADAHQLYLRDSFDYIILSDLVNDLWDVQTVLTQIASIATSQTRIIINTYSRLWELPLKLAQRLGVKTANLEQNWLTVQDLDGLLRLTNFETIRHWSEVLWPVKTRAVAGFFNRYLVKLWPLYYFALTNVILARPQQFRLGANRRPKVSVVIPARNEAGNIDRIIARTPEMGAGTELLFVEGGSHDDTYKVIKNAIEANPHRRCRLLRQNGRGKGDAVRLGFAQATGDIFMILDADMTVPPETLPRFYDALISGKGEFVNGVRLVYPMEEQAMRYLNLIGNKFFSLAFSWLLGQPIKDTLCGTKVLWKKDYEQIAANRSYFGDFDPFGDFDLLFGAVKLNYKILEMPIRYAERTYGATNIDRWRHGWLLVKMVVFAMRRIKFI